MDEVDTLALLSSMLETCTQEVASLKATEPTMRPMSINEMSQVVPNTYNFCQVCGIQGHYGYECSYNVYNSQNAHLGQMNSFEEGYGYNQYSNTCDQEWMDQSTFSYIDNGVQIFCITINNSLSNNIISHMSSRLCNNMNILHSNKKIYMFLKPM
ncbi:hypothetical protein POM88_024249 [Heracleum sosnowskyi]|uniref:Uncharacterized protein n=1 Tax=Heracleum sosnowskyi TaxID=360622 RepID=A0AAD8MIQ6_9APIA|nr:hypothetical protein POM88_024249 [Heracleum sosnowskyi]